MELTYDEIVDILHVKYFAGSTNGYTMVPGFFEFSDNNLLLESLIPSEEKVNIKIDDIRLKSKLTTNKTIKFTKKSFLKQ